MLKINVDTSELLKWARYLADIPRRSRPAVARALNTFGEQVVRNAAQTIADKTDLDVNEIMQMIQVKDADADDLTWEMDASNILPLEQGWQRPWESRDSGDFERETLVKVVTSGDHDVCDICNEAEANSPWTLGELQDLAGKWADYEPPPALGPRTNLLHPNCRCSTQSWTSTRRLPVSFVGGTAAPPELFTARQLGQAIADELRVVIQAQNG